MSRLAWSLLALFVLTRLILVASVADVFGYGEECGKAAAAKAMLDGLPVEHYRLAYVYHEGGGFVITHLKALAFLLVGPTVLANKLVALFTSALALLAGLRLAFVHFGSRAAWIFGLAFVFAPDAFLRFSLLSLGTHFEAAIFIALAIHLTLRIVSRESTTRTWLALGLVLGFGVYFALVTLAAVVWVALALVLCARAELTPRRVGTAFAGAIVGALPLWWMMSHVGLDAVRVRAKEGGASASVTRFEAARDLFSAFDRGELGPWLLAIGFVLLAFAGWRALRAHPDELRARKLKLVGAFVPVFLVLYLASGLAIRPDVGWFFFLRLAPVWFVGTLFVAACAASALDSTDRLRRTGALAALLTILGVGAADLFALARTGDPSRPLANLAECRDTKGYDYAEYFDKFQHHLEGSLEDKIAILRRFDDRSSLLLPAINLSLFEHAGVSLADAVAISKRAYGEEWFVAVQGLRFFVHPKFGHDIPAAFAAIESFDGLERQMLATAIGRAGLGPRFLADKIARQIELDVPTELRSAYLAGTGWRIHRAFALRPDLGREFIARYPPDVAVHLTAGFDVAAIETCYLRF